MKTGWDRLRESGILAVLLWTSVPVVFLWAHNAQDAIPGRDVALVLVTSWLGGLACLGVMRVVGVERHRAALIAVLVVVAVTNLGRVIEVAGGFPGSSVAAQLVLATVVLVGALSYAIARSSVRPGALRVVNLVGAALVALNVVTLAQGGSAAAVSGALASDDVRVGELAVGDDARDVYYLIFDRYAGEATLETEYGFDNSPFLDELRSRGFAVVEDAVANYPGTTHSLASSLNMTYLDQLAGEVGVSSGDWSPLQSSVAGSALERAFDDAGYRTVHAGSWWNVTGRDPSADVNYVFETSREFPQAFLATTAVPYLTRLVGLSDEGDPLRSHYDRVGFQVDAIEEVSRDPLPTFMFVHFTFPHPPYVFDPSGNFRPRSGLPTERAYLDQLEATNRVIGDIVDTLLAPSDDADPIVVLQSDEGPHPIALDNVPELRVPWPTLPDRELQRKMRILEALYLPGVDPDEVPPDLTPVNTFRLILDEYFDTDLPMLPNEAYAFASYDRPYDFVEVTDRVRV